MIPVLLLALAACSVGAPAPLTLRSLYGLAPIHRLDAHRTALVLVDFQREFFTGRLPVPDGVAAAANASSLLGWARRRGVIVVHVRNVTPPGSPLFDGPTAAFVDAVAPAGTELVITKRTGGGFTGTDLDATLRARGVDTLVVAGLMTHLAVAMTAQDAAVRGFRVVVVADATATRDLPAIGHAALHEASLAALGDRFADVLSTAEILRR